MKGAVQEEKRVECVMQTSSQSLDTNVFVRNKYEFCKESLSCWIRLIFMDTLMQTLSMNTINMACTMQ